MAKSLQLILLSLLLTTFSACGARSSKKESAESTDSQEAVAEIETPKPDTLDLTVGEGPIELAAYELHADSLLAMALSDEQLSEGWVRLFDGQTLVGWSMLGQADWHVRDGAIRVTRGEPSFLCTNFNIADFELQVDFRATPKTNSGIFIRSNPNPMDPGLDCIEINIAPPENPYPTGSTVARERVEPEVIGTDFDPTQWHTYWIRADGEHVTIHLDGKKVMDLIDDTSSQRGLISLQHNEGIVEFRNILLRPIERSSLKLAGDWEDDWTTSDKEPGTLKVESTDNGLRVQGGLGQVQSRDDFGDFVLQARYTLASPEVNSGIFFRCIEGNMLDGYECQINHATIDEDPLRPKDGGAGAIFRRRDARIVVGDGTKPTHLTLLASGNQFVTWVNGILTTEFHDDRPADENPRKGSRLDPGPIAIQGHDPETDITLHELQVADLR